ncbi:hypothetical protein KCU71_g10647, partial [Aureobasidium melanogenum]
MARIKNVRSRTVYRSDPASSYAVDAPDKETAQPPTQPHTFASVSGDIPSSATSLQMTQSSNPLTASQQKQQSSQSLQNRAAAGDVDARLLLIPPDEVERELRARKTRDGANTSLWEYLNNPGGDISPIQAAGHVMSAAADVAEDASVDAAYVWRWVQMNSLWDKHPNPEMRSQDAFFSRFGNSNILQLMITLGSSIQYTQVTHNDWIEKHWGGDWYDHIPLSIRPAESMEKLSRRIVKQIAITCANVSSLDEAIAGWQAAITKRIDPAQRKRGTRQKRTSTLTLDDFFSFNESIDAYATGIQQDRLEMKPLNPAAPKPTLAILNKRKRALRDVHATREDSRSKTPKLCVNDRPVVIESDGDSIDDGHTDDRAYADFSAIHKSGDHRIKKVRGHRIIEPVTPPSASLSAGLSQLLDDIPFSSLDGQDHQSQRNVSDSSACDGPEFARLFAKFAEIYEYFEKNGNSSSDLVRNCCDSCREFALRALACLRADLVPSVAGLEQVRHHRFGDAEVQQGQAQNKRTCQSASRAHASSRLLRVVQDSSDEENDEVAL